MSKSSTLVRDLKDNFRGEAEEVMIRRSECVCGVMFHMAAIRSLQPNGSAIITCAGAHRPSQSATAATPGYQAAHLLPGQILVNNQRIFDLADPNHIQLPNGAQMPTIQELTRLRQVTGAEFGNVEPLPKVFNRADSQAEGKSNTAGRLKSLFADVTAQMWKTGRFDPQRPLCIDRDSVFTALNSWFADSHPIYTTAIQAKLQKSLDAQTLATTERRQIEADVLKAYTQCKIVESRRFIDANMSWLRGRYAST